MNTHQATFVRTEHAAPVDAAAARERAVLPGSGKNLFATPKDIGADDHRASLLLAWFLPPVIKWLFIDAAWTGGGRGVCATAAQGGSQPEGWSGACWAFVGAKFDQFIFGRYPIEERWRPTLVGILFVALLVPMLIPKVPLQGPECHPAFRRAADPVASSCCSAACSGSTYVETPALGRPDGHADPFLRRHCRLACRSASFWRSAGDRTCRSSG